MKSHAQSTDTDCRGRRNHCSGYKSEPQELGYEVCSTVATGEEALLRAETERPDLALVDVVLQGGMDGIEAAQFIHSRFSLPVVYLTAYADDKMLERAKMAEPFGY